MNNGKISRRIPSTEVEAFKEQGWKCGRFGFVVTSEAQKHRNQLATLRADKLRKYGFTDEQVAAERKAGNRWCGPHRRFEPKSAFTTKSHGCCKLAEQTRSLTRKCQRYNITLDWYTTQLNAQGGCCALCPATQYSSVNKGPLAIDHDHRCCPIDSSCGKCVRGLLCAKCNLRVYELERFVEEARIIPTSGSWTECAMDYLGANFTSYLTLAVSETSVASINVDRTVEEA